jgi:hypothetical protein
MEEPTIRRIAVDREADWLRVQYNITKGLQTSLDARLATLPGGREGAAAKGVRRELEARIKKVRIGVVMIQQDKCADGRSEKRHSNWQNRIYE